MNRSRNAFTVVAMLTAFVFCTAGIAAAEVANRKDAADAIRSLTSKLDDFETDLRYQMQSSSANTRNVDDGSDRIREMRDATRRFQDNFDRKRENRDDVDPIVAAAKRIAEFLRLYPQNRRVMDDWNAVKIQVDRLSSNFGVTTNWDADAGSQPVRNDPPNPGNTVNAGLSGTYSLDAAKSENVDEIISGAGVPTDRRDDLKDKLTAPDQIAIDIRGNDVTLATSDSSPVGFTANGADKTEPGANGKTVRLHATINGSEMTVSSLGGDTDFTITFTSVSGGQVMKVSRRITTDYLNQTVFAESVYNKTDSVARLGIDTAIGPNTGTSTAANTTSPGTTTTDPNGTYSDNDNHNGVSNGAGNGGNGSGGNGGNGNGGNGNGGYGNNRNGGNGNNRNGGYGNNRNGGYNRGQAPSTVTTKPGNYIVPNGVTLNGTLDNEINTKVSQNNDRFRMTVQSPDQFNGAVVEGYISNVQSSGRVTGQATVTFNFEKITLKDGQTYDFAANLVELRDTMGKNIQIDNESTARGDSQTTQTAKRGGIGGGIGAVIGAIAGGAHGAVLGAIIGSGAGAGSVAAQGRDDIRLVAGSTVSVQSTSPTQLNTR